MEQKSPMPRILKGENVPDRAHSFCCRHFPWSQAVQAKRFDSLGRFERGNR